MHPVYALHDITCARCSRRGAPPGAPRSFDHDNPLRIREYKSKDAERHKMKKYLVAAAVVLISVVLWSCAAATPTPTTVPGGATKGAPAGYGKISAVDLNSMLRSKDFTLVNVHTPYEGEIPGTDLFIRYDQLELNLSLLPGGKDARIVVYCRSGPMGQMAAQTLYSLGYTGVVNLQGGIVAWVEQGYPLTKNPR